MRALKHLQLNGESLLGHVKAVSTVSGGSWAGVAFLYLDGETSDDDYLNRYVADPGRLVPEKTAASSLAETLDQFPPNNIGQGPSERLFSPPGLALTAIILRLAFRVPTDMLWQTLVGIHILKDYGLYDPKIIKKKPTTFYSFDEVVLKEEV